MKTNANKLAAGAAFPSTRLAAPARSLGTARARLSSDDETPPATEKRLKAAASELTRKAVPKRKSVHPPVKTLKRGSAKTRAKARTRAVEIAAVPVGTSSKTKSKTKAQTKSNGRAKSETKAQTKKHSKNQTSASTKKTSASTTKEIKEIKAIKATKAAKAIKATKAQKKPQAQTRTKTLKSKSDARSRPVAKTQPKAKKAGALHAGTPGKATNAPVVAERSTARPGAASVTAAVKAVTIADTARANAKTIKTGSKAAKSTRSHSRQPSVETTSVAPVQAQAQPVPQGRQAPVARVVEVRSAPAVAPSAPATHAGRGDATLARYMSELATYELLGREDEIRLAQEVEALEVAYWRSMLALPRAWDVVEHAIRNSLEAAPDELVALGLAAQKAAAPHAAPHAAKMALARYGREVERVAGQLRAVDIHREAAKATYAALQDFTETLRTDPAAHSVKGRKAFETLMRGVHAARRAQQAAKDRFVAANLRLVVSMARRYAREGRMPLADLIQEGNLGLMKAVERFDHRRGFRFSTYASWWIRHALTRGLADKGRLVRLPVHALETRTRLARATRKLTCRTGVAPTIAELAAETGLDPEKLPAVEELSTEAPFSLDAPVGGDNDRTFLDMLRYEDQTSAEERVVSASHKESLVSLMDELSPFEAQILRYRYGFDGGEERTLKEIGQMYNLSRERIRQIQACALAKMRARVDDEERESAAL